MSAQRDRPLIALCCGDPCGIGPEVACAAISDERVRRAARVVAIGPARCRPADVPLVERAGLEERAWIASEDPGGWRVGRASAEGGRAALAALRVGHELALARAVEALVTAPVSKEALHMAGERVEGQTQLLGRWCGREDVQMLAVVDALRVMLLTRHVPLAEALASIDERKVVAQLHRLRDALNELGIERPRLALAGLNPHAGENGLLGSEEGAVLEPAARRAREFGLDVSGPLSPDSVFLRAWKGEFDGVLALYHDQAFIPVKLVGEGRAVTVLAGLPYLRVSPAHGVAFDLAGSGRARAEDSVAALLQAAGWALARRAGAER